MLRISAKGEYAIRAVLDLALDEGSAVVSIQEIATRQQIPQRYLEQVLLQLKRAGFVLSRRGAAGGYQLTKSPHELTVGAVLRAVEGAHAPARVRVINGVADAELRELWEEIATAVSSVVDRVTFGDLVTRAHERHHAARFMYHI